MFTIQCIIIHQDKGGKGNVKTDLILKHVPPLNTYHIMVKQVQLV